MRSNTNVQCPYRLPIVACTHDPTCQRKSCLAMDPKRLCIIAQRAMKTITGYFGGHISKRQKMGQFEMKASVKALPLMAQKLRARHFKRGSAQLAHVVTRMFTTLESKGIFADRHGRVHAYILVQGARSFGSRILQDMPP